MRFVLPWTVNPVTYYDLKRLNMNVLLIGCGNIGLALLKIWSQNDMPHNILVVQPSMSHAEEFSKHNSIKFINDLSLVPSSFMVDIIVLAVKPQKLAEVAPYLKQCNSHAIIVSLLAGVKHSQLVALAPTHAKIIRIMPNVAIKTGKSINLAFTTDQSNLHDIENIFSPSGKMIWLENENDLDALTPISGSGPAYFFLLAELLRAETVKMGIDDETARKVIYELFIGSASLIYEDTDYEEMINSVTSKKGVTAAALAIMRPAMQDIISKSLQAALKRAQELSDEHRR